MTTHGARLTMAAGLAACLALPAVGKAGPAERSDTQGHRSSAAPESFIEEAATGGLAEVRLGKLAQERAASADVKSFGKRMTDDHSKANAELERLAASKKVTVPKELDAKHKATYDRLSKLSGRQFDEAYMDEMLQDHRHDVAAFEAASQSGDPDVKAFASKTLPTLQHHLQEAERIAGRDDGRRSQAEGERAR